MNPDDEIDLAEACQSGGREDAAKARGLVEETLHSSLAML